MQDAERSTAEALARGELDEATALPENERALLRFVEKTTREASQVADEDVRALREAGWTDDQIAEAVYITALFAFFNRVADSFGLQDPGYLQALDRGEAEGLPRKG